METVQHIALKRLALAWLRARGYAAAAVEVRSPISQWVLDVAGWRDADWDAHIARRVRLPHPHTIIIECKQSRADFLRDSRRHDLLLTLRERYSGIRRSIEEHRIKTLEPQLRCTGTSLFPQLDTWDFKASQLPGYRSVLAKLQRIDRRLHGETKFFRIARYGLADALFIAAPAGLISHRELPTGWGLLECDPACGIGDVASPDALRIAFESDASNQQPSSPRHRTRMLRNIAIAASAQAARSARPDL